MNVYNIAAVSLAVIVYIYLARQIRSGSAEQNLATWSSWVLLDVVAGVSLFVQDGNWYLLAFYVVGGAMIVLCIINPSRSLLKPKFLDVRFSSTKNGSQCVPKPSPALSSG